jgi:hypothetical protein
MAAAAGPSAAGTPPPRGPRRRWRRCGRSSAAASARTGGVRAQPSHTAERRPGAAAVASFLAAVLTEIYLCDVCSCHEILRRNGRGSLHSSGGGGGGGGGTMSGNLRSSNRDSLNVRKPSATTSSSSARSGIGGMDRARSGKPKMLTKKMVMQELLLQMHKKWR